MINSIQRFSRYLPFVFVGVFLAIAPTGHAQVTTNGSTLFNVGTITGQGGLTVTATNTGAQVILLTSGAVLIGGQNANALASGNETVIISNASLNTTTVNVIGGATSNNTLTLL